MSRPVRHAVPAGWPPLQPRQSRRAPALARVALLAVALLDAPRVALAQPAVATGAADAVRAAPSRAVLAGPARAGAGSSPARSAPSLDAQCEYGTPDVAGQALDLAVGADHLWPVVGATADGALVAQGPGQHAVRWSGTPRDSARVLARLGATARDVLYCPTAASAAGAVAGVALDSTPAVWRAGVLRRLALPAGAVAWRLEGVDDSGSAVGWVRTVRPAVRPAPTSTRPTEWRTRRQRPRPDTVSTAVVWPADSGGRDTAPPGAFLVLPALGGDRHAAALGISPGGGLVVGVSAGRGYPGRRRALGAGRLVVWRIDRTPPDRARDTTAGRADAPPAVRAALSLSLRPILQPAVLPFPTATRHVVPRATGRDRVSSPVWTARIADDGTVAATVETTAAGAPAVWTVDRPPDGARRRSDRAPGWRAYWLPLPRRCVRGTADAVLGRDRVVGTCSSPVRPPTEERENWDDPKAPPIMITVWNERATDVSALLRWTLADPPPGDRPAGRGAPPAERRLVPRFVAHVLARRYGGVEFEVGGAAAVAGGGEVVGGSVGRAGGCNACHSPYVFARDSLRVADPDALRP